MRLHYSINPRRIALTLGSIAIILSVISIIGEYLTENVIDGEAHPTQVDLLDLFSVNVEESIPTWFATLILFGAATLLMIIAVGKRKSQNQFAWHWTGLALVFLYLSMDEGAAIHEIASTPIEEGFGTSGFFAFGWLVVGIPCVVILGLLYTRFLLHLPSRTRKLFILAGAMYVGGAVGIEGISANQFDSGGGITFTYLAIATIEEYFEMTGIVIFIYGLLAYLVEMDYALWLNAPAASDVPSATVHHHHPTPTGWQSNLPVLLLIIFLIGTNLGLLVWGLGRNPTEDIPIDQALLAELNVDGVTVIQLDHTFAVDNTEDRQLIGGLLNVYREVILVSIPSVETSLILAGGWLPFDPATVSDFLTAQGEIRFVVFDTNTLQVLTQ